MCLALPDPGPCTQNILRWWHQGSLTVSVTMVFRYYLSRDADCFQFPWGGCAGNDNMFLTRSQVILASHWSLLLMLSSHWLIIPQCLATCDVTHVTSDLGHVATRPRQTRAEPEYSEGDLSSHHQRCHQTPEAGPCSDRLTRYYFDGHLCKMLVFISLIMVSCEVFTIVFFVCFRFEYGGCAGNSNNFFSKSECIRICHW